MGVDMLLTRVYNASKEDVDLVMVAAHGAGDSKCFMLIPLLCIGTNHNRGWIVSVKIRHFAVHSHLSHQYHMEAPRDTNAIHNGRFRQKAVTR